MDQLAGEVAGAAFVGTVVDEVVAVAEVLVVREDDAFVEHAPLFGSEMVLHPFKLVVQSGGVLPRGCGEDIDIVFLGQLVYGLYSARHRVHQGEDARHIVEVAFVSLFRCFVQLVDAGLEIDEDIVHVEEEDGFCHKWIIFIYLHLFEANIHSH